MRAVFLLKPRTSSFFMIEVFCETSPRCFPTPAWGGKPGVLLVEGSLVVPWRSTDTLIGILSYESFKEGFSETSYCCGCENCTSNLGLLFTFMLLFRFICMISLISLCRSFCLISLTRSCCCTLSSSSLSLKNSLNI